MSEPKPPDTNPQPPSDAYRRTAAFEAEQRDLAARENAPAATEPKPEFEEGVASNAAPLSHHPDKWTRAERESFAHDLSDAREEAFKNAKSGVTCIATGSLASQEECATTRGCGNCMAAVAAAKKTSELTGYNWRAEPRTR